jgi:hypothetical protein
MCNQQVTDVMKLYEYPYEEDSHTLRSEILNDLIALTYQFKIDLINWEVHLQEPHGGCSISSNVSDHYITFTFRPNKIIFDGYSTDWIEFSTTDHASDFFAAILAMIINESEAVMAHTCNVN